MGVGVCNVDVHIYVGVGVCNVDVHIYVGGCNVDVSAPTRVHTLFSLHDAFSYRHLLYICILCVCVCVRMYV